MDNLGPLTEQFSLISFTQNLIHDLALLRQGKISVHDARVRAELAKQVLRSLSLVVTAQKFLADNAKPASLAAPKGARKPR